MEILKKYEFSKFSFCTYKTLRFFSSDSEYIDDTASNWL